MTTEAAFTDEEWERVRRAPMVAGMAISRADQGGPIELSKETMATLRGVGAPHSQDELLLVVSQQVMAMGQQRENPMKGFEVADKSQAGAAVLQELRETLDLVEAKATPEEAQAFARWMVEIAQDAAELVQVNIEPLEAIVDPYKAMEPGAPLVYVITGAAYLALVAAHVAGHLGVPGTMPAPRRWRAGAMVAGVILVLVVLASLADDDFSDTPQLAAALKPLSPAWIPADDVDDFGSAIRKARNEADDAANQTPSP